MPIDKSHPVTLNVGETQNGSLAIKVGTVVFEVEMNTAETFAEAILTVLGRMRGINYWVMKAGTPAALSRAKGETSDGPMQGRDGGRQDPRGPGDHPAKH